MQCTRERQDLLASGITLRYAYQAIFDIGIHTYKCSMHMIKYLAKLVLAFSEIDSIK